MSPYRKSHFFTLTKVHYCFPINLNLKINRLSAQRKGVSSLLPYYISILLCVMHLKLRGDVNTIADIKHYITQCDSNELTFAPSKLKCQPLKHRNAMPIYDLNMLKYLLPT